ncbi:NUDIX hydrolase [Eubacteriales bacterium KG127]
MQIKLKDVNRVFRKRIPKPIGKHKYFSVLIPFIEKDSELYLMYEVRALTLRKQPGEVCFPGGQVEEGEGPMTAAIRETCEELGLRKEQITILGRGDILYGYSNYTLFTYVGTISYEDYRRLKWSKSEVDRVFLVKVSDLIKNPPEIYWENISAEFEEEFPYAEELFVDERNPWKNTKWSIPVYSQLNDEEATIWGMTAKITVSTLETIVNELGYGS